MIIRNDDVSFDTSLEEIETFCSICDEFGVGIIQAVVPFGATHHIDFRWPDWRIIDSGGPHLFADNRPVLELLKRRKDSIALHGLWHTHCPSAQQIQAGAFLLRGWGLPATYFVPPFNEGEYDTTVAGLMKIQRVQRLEDYLPGMSLEKEFPHDPIVYLHSWRFQKQYTFNHLRTCLQRIMDTV